MERKRKWDEAPPLPPTSNTQSNSVLNNSDSTLSAVQAAAKRLSQMAPSPIKSDECEREFDINDLSTQTRLYLCKSATQAVITQQTGAVIRTKGSYILRNESNSGEKGLHLFITASNSSEVEAAIEKIKEIIEKDNTRKNPFDVPVYGNYIVQTVAVNLNPVIGFNIIGKLLGPSGAFVKHIQQNSNAKVQLRGKGSRYDEVGSKDSEEPLSFLISAATQTQVDAAIKLIEDLLATVGKEYNQFVQSRPTTRYAPNTSASTPPPVLAPSSTPPQLYPAPPRSQQQQPQPSYPTTTSAPPLPQQPQQPQPQYSNYPGYSYPTAEAYQYNQAQMNQYNQYAAYYSYPGYSYPSADTPSAEQTGYPAYDYSAYYYGQQAAQPTQQTAQTIQSTQPNQHQNPSSNEIPPPPKESSQPKESDLDSVPPPPPSEEGNHSYKNSQDSTQEKPRPVPKLVELDQVGKLFPEEKIPTAKKDVFWKLPNGAESRNPLLKNEEQNQKKIDQLQDEVFSELGLK